MTDFGNLRRLLSEAVISVDKTNTENAAKQATDMKAIHDLALVTSEVLRDTNVKDVMVVTRTPFGSALSLLTLGRV